MNLPNPDTINWDDPEPAGHCSITLDQRAAALDEAYARFANHPHANINVRWSQYLAERDAINALSQETGHV